MKYLLLVPICMALVSGLLWWQADRMQSANAGDAVVAPAASVDAVVEHAPPAVVLQEAVPAAAPSFVVVTPCMVHPIQEQMVSSQLEGHLHEVQVRLGQIVDPGAVLANLDANKLRLQIEMLKIRASSHSEENIAKALFKEAEARVAYAEKANGQNFRAVPDLEYKTYLSQRDRYAQEIVKAAEERHAAEKELKKAEHVLELHQLRAGLQGEVARIFRKAGETVKPAEPLFRLVRTDRLVIEGLAKSDQAPRLYVGQEVLVEPELQGTQQAELIGHTGPITGLAVAADGKLVASSSQDGTVRLWSWPARAERVVLPHPAPVHDVALYADPKQPAEYVVVSACEDRKIRVWHLGANGQVRGPHELLGHTSAVRCLQLSADGKRCASGGDDHRIGWWDLETRQLLGWVHALSAARPTAHQGAVTDVELSSDGSLISVARDNTVKVWSPSKRGFELARTFRDRTGDVPQLGLTAAGTHILFDHGDELRLLQRDSGAVQARLESTRNARFRDFAHYAPSGELLLAATSDGCVRLWKMAEDHPGSDFELRYYRLPKASVARCAVFATDERHFLTGGSDHAIRVWAVPERSLWQRYQARLTFVSNELEPGTDLVRVQAEMDNRLPQSRRLRPGTYVTLKATPTTKN